MAKSDKAFMDKIRSLNFITAKPSPPPEGPICEDCGHEMELKEATLTKFDTSGRVIYKKTWKR